MDWDAIGAIGEIVGAIAVVATLGYLAVQIRQNSEQVKSATEIEATKQIGQIFARAGSDENLKRIWEKASANEELSAEDEADWAWY